MTILETISHFQRTWEVLLPHIPTPPSEDAARWVGYPVGAVEQAMIRTARKFSALKIDPHTFDSTVAYRYTTSTARSIAGQKVGAAW